MWSGGLDNILKSFDINSSTESAHGSHEGAIKCVEFSAECGLVVTGSWDSTVTFAAYELPKIWICVER